LDVAAGGEDAGCLARVARGELVGLPQSAGQQATPLREKATAKATEI